jgi:hypothetical protein
MPRKPTISPKVRAAALAELLAGEQPAVVAAKYGIDAGTVRMWKTRYVASDVAPVAPTQPLSKPVLEAQKVSIGEIILDLLAAKLKASQALAEAVNDPAWIRSQPAAELAALGQWLDGSAFAIGDRLAGAREPDDSE